ncbi:hypothetical protein ACFW04_005110 [Cataglyphis niger]
MGLNPILPFRNYSSILKVKPRSRDDIFAQNDNSESEDDITSGSDDYTSSSDYSGENGNENYTSSHKLFTPPLEDLRNILYVALNPYFEELEIEVVSCPCLTRAPYNLAAAGLSGSTGILRIGTFDNFYPRPRTYKVYNIHDRLSRCNNDFFVIGSGFATQPWMPYNGHLTMNAVVSANSRNVINNSCIAYEVVTNELIMQTINDRNQIKCCLFGQFFFSEGKRGPVIKMRAKGRRSRSNIIALIQSALTIHCLNQPLLIGLGIVLIINGGLTVQLLLPNNFLSYDYNKILDYYHKLSQYSMNCINLVALGTIISESLMPFEDNDKKRYSIGNYSMFNTFFNNESFGNFFNDTTPKNTEYIIYINTAQERCF